MAQAQVLCGRRTTQSSSFRGHTGGGVHRQDQTTAPRACVLRVAACGLPPGETRTRRGGASIPRRRQKGKVRCSTVHTRAKAWHGMAASSNLSSVPTDQLMCVCVRSSSDFSRSQARPLTKRFPILYVYACSSPPLRPKKKKTDTFHHNINCLIKLYVF